MSTEPSTGEFTQGTEIIHVRNLDLAVCLVSVGVSLRKDPPYTHVRLKNGEDQWIFNFYPRSRDKVYNTLDLCAAFAQDMKWITENPQHPFTFAMVAVKNLDIFKGHMSRDVPYVAFSASGGRATLYVQEGSRKHQRCLAKGMVQK